MPALKVSGLSQALDFDFLAFFRRIVLGLSQPEPLALALSGGWIPEGRFGD